MVYSVTNADLFPSESPSSNTIRSADLSGVSVEAKAAPKIKITAVHNQGTARPTP